MILLIIIGVVTLFMILSVTAASNWVTANYVAAEYHIFSTINDLRRSHGLTPVSCAHHMVDVQKTVMFPCNLNQITPSVIVAAYGEIIFDPSIRRISVDLDIAMLRFLLFRECVVMVGATRTP
jgi:hypothetical protein